MAGDGRVKDLRDRLAAFGIAAACVLMDIAFAALWAVAQWALHDYVIQPLELYGIHRWILLAFQVIFAISTLAVVLVYMYEDIAVMILRARGRVAHERTRLKREGPDNERAK